MKTAKSETNEELTSLIEKAADFHGHLGPFLVIGVRMGSSAKKVFSENSGESGELRATARLPLLTPFSCILDGIQATTQCTVGNQKLRMENSQEKIIAYFKQQNSDKTLRLQVNPKIIEYLKNGFSEGASNEELAWEIAFIPEDQLFVMEKP